MESINSMLVKRVYNSTWLLTTSVWKLVSRVYGGRSLTVTIESLTVESLTVELLTVESLMVKSLTVESLMVEH